MIMGSCMFLIHSWFEFIDILSKSCKVESYWWVLRGHSQRPFINSVGFCGFALDFKWINGLLDQSRVWFKAFQI